MEANDIPEGQMPAASANENSPESPPDVEVSTHGRDARRKRIADYEAAGLAKPDPGDACLAIINTDLIGLASDLADAIKESLTEGQTKADSVRRIEPALNNYLKVTRQVERFMQLEVRAAEARKQAAKVQEQLQMLAL